MLRRLRPAAILASDADRQDSVALLRDAVVGGRLTLDEFGERVDLAHRARTDRELAALTVDIRARAAEPRARYRAVCSHLVRRGAWVVPSRSSWHSLFGTIELDLRQARLASPDVELTVRNLFGTVTVLVPAGLTVDVQGQGLFATQVLEPPLRPPAHGAPRVRIRSSGPGGTLYVRRSSAQRLLDRLIVGCRNWLKG